MPESRIAVIPARGGSKRVPGKNIRPLGGVPLIGRAIEAARESGLFERIVVSTDVQDIADLALRFGAEVPFLRDSSLADDHTPVSQVTIDVLSRLDPDGTRYRAVCQLMPNCPLRDAADLHQSWENFERTGAQSQISVYLSGWSNPWWTFRMNGESVLEPLFPEAMKQRSQDLEELYFPTGAVWWAQPVALRSSGTFHMPGRTGWVMDWKHAMDIDTEEDWQFAELLFQMGAQQS